MDVAAVKMQCWFGPLHLPPWKLPLSSVYSKSMTKQNSRTKICSSKIGDSAKGKLWLQDSALAWMNIFATRLQSGTFSIQCFFLPSLFAQVVNCFMTSRQLSLSLSLLSQINILHMIVTSSQKTWSSRVTLNADIQTYMNYWFLSWSTPIFHITDVFALTQGRHR